MNGRCCEASTHVPTRDMLLTAVTTWATAVAIRNGQSVAEVLALVMHGDATRRRSGQLTLPEDER
jgi:hypothetical protein